MILIRATRYARGVIHVTSHLFVIYPTCCPLVRFSHIVYTKDALVSRVVFELSALLPSECSVKRKTSADIALSFTLKKRVTSS